MEPPRSYADLPRECYPFKLEALHFISRAVVWSKNIDAPPDGEKVVVSIPPLRKMFGHPVAMRATFADGTVKVEEPRYGAH